jgi:hypothetical protein
MNVSLGQGLVGKAYCYVHLASTGDCWICLEVEQRPWIGSVWKHIEEMSV